MPPRSSGKKDAIVRACNDLPPEGLTLEEIIEKIEREQNVVIEMAYGRKVVTDLDSDKVIRAVLVDGDIVYKAGQLRVIDGRTVTDDALAGGSRTRRTSSQASYSAQPRGESPPADAVPDKKGNGATTKKPGKRPKAAAKAKKLQDKPAKQVVDLDDDDDNMDAPLSSMLRARSSDGTSKDGDADGDDNAASVKHAPSGERAKKSELPPTGVEETPSRDAPASEDEPPASAPRPPPPPSSESTPPAPSSSDGAIKRPAGGFLPKRRGLPKPLELSSAASPADPLPSPTDAAAPSPSAAAAPSPSAAAAPSPSAAAAPSPRSEPHISPPQSAEPSPRGGGEEEPKGGCGIVDDESWKNEDRELAGWRTRTDDPAWRPRNFRGRNWETPGANPSWAQPRPPGYRRFGAPEPPPPPEPPEELAPQPPARRKWQDVHLSSSKPAPPAAPPRTASAGRLPGGGFSSGPPADSTAVRSATLRDPRAKVKSEAEAAAALHAARPAAYGATGQTLYAADPRSKVKPELDVVAVYGADPRSKVKADAEAGVALHVTQLPTSYASAYGQAHGQPAYPPAYPPAPGAQSVYAPDAFSQVRPTQASQLGMHGIAEALKVPTSTLTEAAAQALLRQLQGQEKHVNVPQTAVDPAILELLSKIAPAASQRNLLDGWTGAMKHGEATAVVANAWPYRSADGRPPPPTAFQVASRLPADLALEMLQELAAAGKVAAAFGAREPVPACGIAPLYRSVLAGSGAGPAAEGAEDAFVLFAHETDAEGRKPDRSVPSLRAFLIRSRALRPGSHTDLINTLCIPETMSLYEHPYFLVFALHMDVNTFWDKEKYKGEVKRRAEAERSAIEAKKREKEKGAAVAPAPLPGPGGVRRHSGDGDETTMSSPTGDPVTPRGTVPVPPHAPFGFEASVPSVSEGSAPPAPLTSASRGPILPPVISCSLLQAQLAASSPELPPPPPAHAHPVPAAAAPSARPWGQPAAVPGPKSGPKPKREPPPAPVELPPPPPPPPVVEVPDWSRVPPDAEALAEKIAPLLKIHIPGSKSGLPAALLGKAFSERYGPIKDHVTPALRNAIAFKTDTPGAVPQTPTDPQLTTLLRFLFPSSLAVASAAKGATVSFSLSFAAGPEGVDQDLARLREAVVDARERAQSESARPSKRPRSPGEPSPTGPSSKRPSDASPSSASKRGREASPRGGRRGADPPPLSAKARPPSPPPRRPRPRSRSRSPPRRGSRSPPKALAELRRQRELKERGDRPRSRSPPRRPRSPSPPRRPRSPSPPRRPRSPPARRRDSPERRRGEGRGAEDDARFARLAAVLQSFADEGTGKMSVPAIVNEYRRLWREAVEGAEDPPALAARLNDAFRHTVRTSPQARPPVAYFEKRPPLSLAEAVRANLARDAAARRIADLPRLIASLQASSGPRSPSQSAARPTHATRPSPPRSGDRKRPSDEELISPLKPHLGSTSNDPLSPLRSGPTVSADPRPAGQALYSPTLPFAVSPVHDETAPMLPVSPPRWLEGYEPETLPLPF